MHCVFALENVKRLFFWPDFASQSASEIEYEQHAVVMDGNQLRYCYVKFQPGDSGHWDWLPDNEWPKGSAHHRQFVPATWYDVKVAIFRQYSTWIKCVYMLWPLQCITWTIIRMCFTRRSKKVSMQSLLVFAVHSKSRWLSLRANVSQFPLN